MQNVDNSVKAMSEGMQSDRILLGTNLLGTKVNVVGGGFELSGAGGVKGYTTLAENEDLLEDKPFTWHLHARQEKLAC